MSSGFAAEGKAAHSHSPAPSMAPQSLLLSGLLALLVPTASRPPAANAGAAPTVQVTVGVLLPERNLSYPWAWPRVSPALSLALEALQPHLSHAGLAVRTVFASTEDKNGTCEENVAVFKVAELKTSHDPDVLLGLGCIYANDGVAPITQHWQRPLLRAGAYRRYSAHSTEVYTGPLGRDDFSAFEAQLFRRFNWTFSPVVVIGPESEYLASYLSSFLGSEEHFSNFPAFIKRSHLYEEPGKAIGFIQATGRVVYIYGSLEMLQDIMQLAQAQTMTNGDYIFFYLDPFGESLRAAGHCEAAKPWQSKETQDTGGLREAFQTVLVITSHEPQTPEYRRFQSQLVLRAQRDFGVALNDSLGHLVAGCFHDGLLLYLRALNETLSEGGTKRDTSHILEKMRAQKFQGVTGMVSINSKNDREMDFDLWAMKEVESGEFQVVGHYMASEKRINWTGPIHWKKGVPPLDNPPCVFNMNGSSCGIHYATSNAPFSPHSAA